MIGAKTLAMLALFAVEMVTAAALGVLSPARIATRGWGALFVVGCFAAVVGTLMFRFWRLGDPSKHYFRWSSDLVPWERTEGHFLGSERHRVTLGENQGDAFDLPPWLHHALSVAIAGVLAFGCIDARAVALLGRFRESFARGGGAGYCPDPDAQPAAVHDPNLPGCELIRRAYALGYADSLGDCAPKIETRAATVECTRRRHDEPLLHYSWRRLDEFWSRLGAERNRNWLAELKQDFHVRMGHLSSLRRAERQVLASAPHAAHHIFTNLPDPGDDAFGRKCDDHYRVLPHRPPANATPSRVLEYVLAQLLFEGSYEPAAGSCRELHVHWSAPPDSCRRLAADPRGFLKSTGALESVDAVLDRWRVESELAALNKQKPPPAPTTALSFACYIEGDPAPRTSTPFKLEDQALSVEELHVPRTHDALSVDRYTAVAQLLVSGFHYGRLLSAAGIDAGAAPALQAAFAGHDYLLTRLYGLENVDLYVEPGWIASRPDLLEVYPYQRHLKNFVQTFRRQYRQERGRL